MSEHLLVFGDWGVRHNEPCPGERAALSLRRLPAGGKAPADHSLLLDLRTELQEAGRVGPEGTFTCASAAMVACANLASREVPLAAVSVEGGWVQTTHLLTRLEKQITHLIRPHVEVPMCRLQELPGALRQAFEANHLYLNNFECYYNKGMPDTELEQKFNIRGAYDYHILNRRWFEALAEGAIPGFAPQLGDEIQHWSYDNDFARIQANTDGVSGYLSVMHWSRARKASWDDRVVTLKKKLYSEDALERWERNYPNQRIEGSPEETMRSFFKLPIAMLPSWRRTRYDMACEATATGNIFMINFEDSRVRNDDTDRGRLQQCEIEYLKTRGRPQDSLIYADLARLSDLVEAFIRAQDLACERTNYSKLTFLEDYVRAGAPARPEHAGEQAAA